MRALVDTIAICESTFRILEAGIPDPVRVTKGDDFVFRYDQHSPEIVIVQKLARIVSGLYASIALFEKGLYQELGTIFRLQDEFREDVSFMCDAIRRGELSNIQQRFVDDFFQEEFDSESPLLSTQRRDRVPRRQIQAALARAEVSELNPGNSQELSRTITAALAKDKKTHGDE